MTRASRSTAVAAAHSYVVCVMYTLMLIDLAVRLQFKLSEVI
jgi:hypothetical protein